MSKKQHEPEHIIVQLRKVVNTHGHSNVRFKTETKEDVTIAEAQEVLAMYNDAIPRDKELIQKYVSTSHSNLQQVASGEWIPYLTVEHVRARQLFNNDEIFGLLPSPAKVHRRIIKKVAHVNN